MEQNNFELNTIKIKLLEIKPPLKELEKNNNEISIIFQGINVFYNLSKLISNNTEILINNCKSSVIISLVKSDNIFASALFNIKPGENWVTFNYESKQKSPSAKKSNINNINFIKIKIFCNQKNNKKNPVEKNNKNNNNKSQINSRNNKKYNTKRYHKNSNIFDDNLLNSNNNNEIKSHIRYDSHLLENKNKYLSSINVNKTNSNTPLNKYSSQKIKYSELTLKTRNVINKTNYSNIKKSELSSINNNNKRLNSSSSRCLKNNNNTNKNNIYNFHSYKAPKKNKTKIRTLHNFENLNNILERNAELNTNNYKNKNNKIKVNNSNNNLYFLNQSPILNKFEGNINSIKSKAYSNNLFFGYNKNNKKNFNNSLNVNKNKKGLKNRLFKNNLQGNITNSYSTATTKKNEFEGSLNSLQDYEDRINNKKINKKYKYPLTTRRQKAKKESACIENKSQLQLIIDNNMNMNINKNIEKAKSLNCNINENNILENNFDMDNYINYIEKMKMEENEDEDEDNEFFRLKSDFDLLYNEEYIYNIKNDLLKLEIELFVEKMIELISGYHKEIGLKIEENKILKNIYKQNSKKYTSLFKLSNKLQLIKDKYDAKKINLIVNKNKIKQQKTNNLLLNKEEFNLFDEIINNKKSNLTKIKNIKNFDINKYLKDILNIILVKNNNIDILLFNEKYQNSIETKFLINNNNLNENNNQLNKKIRTRAIPQRQHTKILSNFNKELNNNLYNNFKNEGGIYVKKGINSPSLYSAKKRLYQKNSVYN